MTELKDNPYSPKKVFISHASEDQTRFVEDFATKLRANGIDAWYAPWEIRGGDFIVEKVFDNIGDADAFIIILSKNSCEKPWVIEELYAGVIRRIKEKIKIIPVVIEDCQIPESLKGTYQIRINDISNYEKEFEKIIDAIYNFERKPVLGSPPAYIRQKQALNIPRFSKFDNFLFYITCKHAIETDSLIVKSKHFLEIPELADASRDQILESLEIFKNHYYIEELHIFESFFFFKLSHQGLGVYLENDPNFNVLLKHCIALIVNEKIDKGSILMEKLDSPRLVIDYILRSLHNQALIKLISSNKESFIIYISPELPRYLQ